MSVTYRQAGVPDAARIALVAAATFPLACPAHTTAAGIQSFVTTQLSPERFAEYLADDSRLIFVAEEDGLPVGYTMVILGEPGDPDVAGSITLHPSSELSKCYVVAGHHGGGIAAELMRRSIEAATARGASGIWLGVNNENARANRFYEKHSFVVVGTKSFTLGAEVENDFVRERSLR